MAKAESVRPISTFRSVRDEFCGELTLKFSNQSRPKEVLAGWINLNRGKNTAHCPCARNRSEKDSTRGRTLTLERRVFATAATTEQIAIDGGGDHQREVAGGERTIRRPEEAKQVTCG